MGHNAPYRDCRISKSYELAAGLQPFEASLLLRFLLSLLEVKLSGLGIE